MEVKVGVLKKIRLVFALNGLSAVISFSVTILIVKLFGTVELGTFANWLSYIFVIGSIASSRFEQALYVGKDDELVPLTFISLSVLFCISLICLLILNLLDTEIVPRINNQYIFWGVLSYGLFNVATPLSIRAFSLDQAAFFKLAVNACFFIGIYSSYLIFPDVAEIVLASYIVAYGIISLTLIGWIFSLSLRSAMSNAFKVSTFRALVAKYINFPRHDVVSVLAHTLSMNFHFIFLPFFYGSAEIGFVALVLRLADGLILLFGTPMQIYFNKTAFSRAEVSHEKTLLSTYQNTFKCLCLVTFIVVCIFTVSLWLYKIIFFSGSVENYWTLIFVVVWWKCSELMVYPTTTILFHYNDQKWLACLRYLTLGIKILVYPIFYIVPFEAAFILLASTSAVYYGALIVRIHYLNKRFKGQKYGNIN